LKDFMTLIPPAVLPS